MLFDKEKEEYATYCMMTYPSFMKYMIFYQKSTVRQQRPNRSLLYDNSSPTVLVLYCTILNATECLV